ncbi:ATP-binding protein [Zavarzinia sp.]|uniref:ATP-binding protein n=1 Tax=Zavarzinia sp. TaxID=2027920 RepID=UPI003BB73C37
MARLGIVWRLVLILLAALILVQLITTTVYFWRREQAFDARLRSPIADQVAAMASLVDEADPLEREIMLRAFNSQDLLVSITADRGAVLPEGRPLRPMEGRIRAELPALSPPRVVVVRMEADIEQSRRLPLLSRLFAGKVAATVGLSDGRFLHVLADGDLMPRLFGLQPGFFAGIIGFMVALLVIVLFTRESKPLRLLARSVQDFGRDAEPRPVKEAGAAEVRVLIRAFNDMQGRLSELMRNRAFILGALAHDLRTYLTRLRLRAEFLPDEADKDQWIRNLDHMGRMVEDSLTFAKVSFGADREARSDLAQIARREIEERQALGLAVTGNLSEAVAPVAGGETALARALANLVDNALKYAGNAEISLTREGGTLLLAVEDRGPGLPMAARDQLGQPFQQADAARTKGTSVGGPQAGAGLGLAIAREIAAGLGGDLVLGDRPGGGARVVLRMPAISS